MTRIDQCPECGHDKDQHSKDGCEACYKAAEWDWEHPLCERVYQYGWTACWKEDSSGHHCRKPQNHEGECAYF